jgi:hypothetical protein
MRRVRRRESQNRAAKRSREPEGCGRRYYSLFRAGGGIGENRGYRLHLDRGLVRG